MITIKKDINWLDNFINHPEEYEMQLILNNQTDEMLQPYVDTFIESQKDAVTDVYLILHTKERYVCFLVSDNSFSIITDYCTEDEAKYFVDHTEHITKSVMSVMNQLQEKLEELEDKYLGGNE